MSGQSTIINTNAVRELKELYVPIQKEIKVRLNEFKDIWNMGSEEDIFAELVFCILTPQSKAKSCYDAVGCLLGKDILIGGSEKQVGRELKSKVRFHNTKAKNIVEARKIFMKEKKISIKPVISKFKDSKETREWLVGNIRGLGYKEASHFLRNIGKGEELAILDRHILKNLVTFGVIKEVPDSLSKNKYLEIEEKMKEFSRKIKLPMAHLDLLLWFKETGEVFK